MKKIKNNKKLEAFLNFTRVSNPRKVISTAHYSSPIIHHPLPITHHSSLITHHLSLITHCLLLITYCLSSVACQETTKGCLDVRAINFDVTVTQACEDNCCIYPNLTLQADYFYDTTKFSFNKKYKIDNVADSIEFLSFQFYLSDFQLVTSNNKIATVIDSILIARNSDTIKTLSNYALVGKNNGFEFKIGKFDKPTKYAKIKFQVGLDNIANQAIPSKMPSGTPLSNQSDSMYLKAQNTYIFNKIVYKLKSKPDTVSIFITTVTPLTFTKNVSFTEGFDAKIPLKIDYKKFIKDIKFTETKDIIKQRIVTNTKDAFSIQ